MVEVIPPESHDKKTEMEPLQSAPRKADDRYNAIIKEDSFQPNKIKATLLTNLSKNSHGL